MLHLYHFKVVEKVSARTVSVNALLNGDKASARTVSARINGDEKIKWKETFI